MLTSAIRIIFCLLLSLHLYTAVCAQEYTVSNTKYSVKYNVANNNLEFKDVANPLDISIFKMSFKVMSQAVRVSPGRVRISENVNYSVASWSNNTDMYSAGTTENPVVQNVSQSGNALLFQFVTTSRYELTARLEMPVDGSNFPILSYQFLAKTAGTYSVGFTGTPEISPNLLDELWQPMVWTEKKFPEAAYLTPSYHCSLPATMATNGGITYGIIADPQNYPFNPLPSFARSEFGVAIRNENANAQPMLWAPILGSNQSQMAIGYTWQFKMRLFAERKSIVDFYKDLSDNLYGFKDYDRNNELGSLNTTIENMLAYGMSPYSRFDSLYKSPSYQTDVPGGVKNTTALSPLNISILSDNPQIFEKRAMPTLEFMLSRNNRTFSSNDVPNSSSALGNPVMPVSEMVAVYNISGKKTPFLLDMARNKMVNLSNKAHIRQWRDYIALYRATGEETYKQQAMASADLYIADRIDQLETGFNYQHHSSSSFWVELAPKFTDLMELYDISGESRFLDAAYKAARRYAMYTFMSPAVPNGNILVNQGNKAPVYRSGVGPISIPEEEVPAWRMSEYGLHPEAAGTFTTHRAVFMAHHAPYFLRIGILKNDVYLQRIAKSAIIGRYTSFPGYHINTERTSVYEKPDFALRAHEELTSTSMHYNHVWPMISLMYDYLITDMQVKSQGKINFPYEFMEGEANIQDRLYGSRPGKFYGVDSALLWMPAKLLTIDNPQANYIAARKTDTLLLAFSNQSASSIYPNITIDTELVKNLENKQLQYAEGDGTVINTVLTDNSFSIPIAANGITHVKIIAVQPSISALQESLFNTVDTSWISDNTNSSFASVKAMRFSFGKDISRIFVYSAATVGTYTKVEIKYTLNGTDTLTLTDDDYPFEFSIPLSGTDKVFKYYITTTDANGQTATSEEMVLSQIILPKTVIGGRSFIRAGETASLKVDLQGTAPWDFIYSDGNQQHTVQNITQTPYLLNLSPQSNTTYTLVSSHDANGSSEISGSAAVYVAESHLNPVFDGYLRRSDDRGFFNTASLETKISGANAREIFISVNPSLLPQTLVGKAALRIYIHKADKVVNAKFRLEAIPQEFDSSLKWTTRPGDNEFVRAADDVTYEQWQLPGYVSWDITDYLVSFKASGATKLTFRIVLFEGNDVLLTAYSSRNSTLKPELIFTSGNTLDIQLLNLALQTVNEGVKVLWDAKTDTESNYFEIERATENGILKPITKVQITAKGNTKKYSFLDKETIKGVNYYKIKHYSINGAVAETEVKSIKYELKESLYINVYPNPSDGVFRLSVNNSPTKFDIKIYDLMGRRCYAKSFLQTEDKEYETIDLSSLKLPRGTYLLHYTDGGMVKVIKLTLR